MKILKKLLLGLAVLITIPLVLALFIKKDFNSERSIIIRQPRQEVFNYIRFVKNQDNYGVWNLSDPDMKKDYSGTDGQVGFVYKWDGKKMGEGQQKIIDIKENERIDYELKFGYSDEPVFAHLQTKEIAPDQTEVVWGISGKMPYPFNFMGLFFDMGEDLDQSLHNLKDQLEK